MPQPVQHAVIPQGIPVPQWHCRGGNNGVPSSPPEECQVQQIHQCHSLEGTSVVSAGTEVRFFLAAGAVLCFGLGVRTTLMML